MGKSVKIALIGFLIVLAYVTSVYLEKGFWLIPYPLFSYVVFGVVMATLLQDKQNVKIYVPLLVLVVLRCFANPLTYTFFMDADAITEFKEGITFSVLRVLQILAVFPVVIFAIGFQKIKQKITALALCALLLLFLILPLEVGIYSFFTLFVMTMGYAKAQLPTMPSLILMALFDLLEGYSLLFA